MDKEPSYLCELFACSACRAAPAVPNVLAKLAPQKKECHRLRGVCWLPLAAWEIDTE